VKAKKTKARCSWVNLSNPLYVSYHDKEWGKPVHDDRKHFEMLTLEGAQAGLSWETILKKRENYKKAFDNFNPQKVAKYTSAKIKSLLENPGIVRNRLKVQSTVTNAKAFLNVKEEFGSFDKYIWAYVDGKPIVNSFKNSKDYPTKTLISDKISKDLKKRGFRFVGSTIIYAYMQAIGMVNDHALDCFLKKKIAKRGVSIKYKQLVVLFILEKPKMFKKEF
jgi:DNA-3-methyladenine glycosylase I